MINQTISHYRITAKLGAGGMGVVYRAEDLKLDRTVALKFLAPEFVRDTDAKARFVHEAKAASALDHPNICTIHSIEETEDGRLFIAMACYEGETLKDMIASGPVAVEEAATIGAQVAQGLAKAHSLGIVHRDIKPANVFVTEDGLVKLLDFGIAKLAGGTQMTQTGAVVGTVHYMSPEQIQGGEVDRRTDVWSLGVVLYEMLAGAPPFRGEASQAIAYAIVNTEPTPLPERRPDVPAELAQVVARCLQKAAPERYQGAGDLLLHIGTVAGPRDSVVTTARNANLRQLTEARQARPYPGLASFTARDAEFFHGRGAKVESVWQKLRRARMLAVTGPSGVGKTSFLQAGLIPAQAEGWGVLLLKPGGSPFLALREALVTELTDDADAIKSLLREHDLDATVRGVRRWRRRHDEALLILDQFEELFTLNTSDEQIRFTDMLSRLVFEADVHVLLSLRDDFLYHCYEHPGLTPVFESLTVLGPLTGGALRGAVMKPAQDCGYEFEDETLVEEMMAAVEGERGALPLLAFAMAQLWERRDREKGLITREAYEQIGQVGGALAQHAEAVMEQIGADRHPLVREIFRNLVTGQKTRTVLDREDLLSVFDVEARPAAEDILRRLIDARLLTTYESKGEDGSAHHRVEIVHESLLSAWPRLVRWQTQDADGAQLRDQLRQAAQLWEQKGRTEDLLWTGTAYQEFALWRERYPGGLSLQEESFAQAMAARAVRRRRRRRLAVSGAFVVLLAVLGIVGGLWQQTKAEVRRKDAAKLMNYAEDWDIDLNNSRTLALALASLELDDTPDARRLALRALARAPTRLVLTNPDTMFSTLSAALSPDGSFLATTNDDGVLIWPSDGSEPRSLTCETTAIPFQTMGIDIHPSGEYLVASRVAVGQFNREGIAVDRAVTLWSVPDGQRLATWQIAQSLSCVAFVRGGPAQVYVATHFQSEGPYELRRYTVGQAEPERLVASPEPHNFYLSADGRRLVYADSNRVCMIAVDSLATADPVVVGRHEAPLRNVIFSRDDARIASVDQSGVIRVWSGRPNGCFDLVFDQYIDNSINYVSDIDRTGTHITFVRNNAAHVELLTLDEQRIQPIRILPSRAFAIVPAFTPDARWLVTGRCDERLSKDWYCDFYPLEYPRPWSSRVNPDDDEVVPDFFLPNGEMVVARGRMEELLLCDVGGRRPSVRSLWKNPFGRFECAVPGPDGRYIIVNNWREKRALVIPLDGSDPIVLGPPQGIIDGIAAEPGGYRVAVSGGQRFSEGMPDEPIVTIYDLHSGQEQVLEAEGKCGFFGVGFLPDESLFSYSHEGLLIWDLTTGNYERISDRQYDPLVRSDLDASRRYLLVNTPAGVTLWDLRERTERTLPIPTKGLNALAIAPDASFVVAGMENTDVLVLNLDSGELHTLVGHSEWVSDVWISPDCQEIRSVGADGLVFGWTVPDGEDHFSAPRAKLVKFLRSQTNMRAVLDPSADDGYRIEYDPFPGWEVAPTWQ